MHIAMLHEGGSSSKCVTDTSDTRVANIANLRRRPTPSDTSVRPDQLVGIPLESLRKSEID